MTHSHRRSRTLAALATTVSLLLAIPTLAQASTFTVTQTGDATGTCQVAGPCTLRQAIASAQDGDTVSIAVGTYALTAAAGGTIPIVHSITITGAGNTPANTVIDGQSAGARIFDIAGTQTVTIEDVTLANGQTNDQNSGSAILAENGGTVNLSNAVLDGNAGRSRRSTTPST